jgi:hypothetical protein
VLSSVIAAANPSHVPFFIAGGVLAVWAVVLSYIGMKRPAFPYGATGQRAVVGFSALLAAIAIAMAVITG